MSRRPALLGALILACPAIRAQSANIDWSHVTIDANGGETAGEPRVEGVDDDAVVRAALTAVLEKNSKGFIGFYANSDGFYGRTGHTEYLILKRGDQGELEAFKLLGDANVPRGHHTFRTNPGALDLDSITSRMPIQLKLRDDPSDADGFVWSAFHHDLVWDGDVSADLEEFFIEGINPSGSARSRFHRVEPAEAVEAAKRLPDAP